MNIKHNFTEKDEAYLFIFHSKTNNLDHYDRTVSVFEDGIPTYGGTVYAVVNSNGLIMFGHMVCMIFRKQYRKITI